MINQQSIFNLHGKVAIVTGAYGDLGYEISKAYVESGASVILTGINKNKLDLARKKLNKFSNKVSSYILDVTKPYQVNKTISLIIKKYGKIDILVTAAGVQHRSSFIDFNHKAWDKVINTNLDGTFYCAQAISKHMITRKTGRIIMITSLTAEIGIPKISAYAASRGGIKQLCKTMAVELAPFGITVNSVGPGRFKTNMTKDIFSNTTKRKKFLDVIPMKRPGIPSDLKGIFIFLASDSSSYITGQSIYVDGGWLAGCGNIHG